MDVKVCVNDPKRVAAQNHLVHVTRGTSQERPVVVGGLDEWIQADGRADCWVVTRRAIWCQGWSMGGGHHSVLWWSSHGKDVSAARQAG